MKKSLFIVLSSVITLSSAPGFCADWASLNATVADHYQKREFAKAVPVAEEALALAEKTYGAESPETALSLNNLAMLCRYTKDYGKAEKLYHRALLISEKIVGPDSPELAVTLNNLAVLYAAQKEYGKAFEVSDHALRILEDKYGANHPSVGQALLRYAALKREAGKTAEAAKLEARAKSSS